MKNNILVILFLALGLAIGGLAGYCINDFDLFKKEEIVEEVEVEPEVIETEDGILTITREEVSSALENIEELATKQGNYKVEVNTEETKDTDWEGIFKKINDALTTNIIDFSCEGIVKVGIKNFYAINIDISEDTIYVTVPEVEVLDNYIDWETVQVETKDNLLHPIDTKRYQDLIKKVYSIGEQDVRKEGIFEEAQENLENLIEKLLNPFKNEGYKINVSTVGENDDK